MNDMATQTFYRAANVSSAEATNSLFLRFPKADLINFEKKVANAEEAKSAGVGEGELVYAATVRVAEFPPADDAGDEGSEPKSDKAPPAPNSESDPDADGDDDSSPEGDSDHDFAGKGEGEGEGGEGAKPKKLSPDEQIVHLLTQILDALKGGGAPGAGDPMGGPGDGLDLPDVGAPDQGEGLPSAPGMGGPPGKAPLPPPVKEKGPVGVGAFAHVAGSAEITMVRADAGEVNNSAIISEASTYAPTHRVAKIQRTGYATLNGEEVYLPEARLAVVTLVAK